MKKKKLNIASSVYQSKLPARRGRRRKTDEYVDEYDEQIDEIDDTDQLDDQLDEFEQSQSLARTPATLHCEEQVEDEENDEENDGDTKNTKVDISINFNARGDKNVHYVKPAEFELLIQSYYKTGVLSNDLCDRVYKIANRLSYRPNFVNYSFREEMVGDAIERMVCALTSRIYKYNPNKIGKNGVKGNAFLYFTKIAENAFINRIKIEARNREAITKYQEEVYQNLLQKGIDIGSKNTNINNDV